jgi:1-acyl-sn-glycerol-3-phosphate acyltransferase
VNSNRRRFGRTRAVLSIASGFALVPPWFAVKPQSAAGRAIALRFFRRMAHAFVGCIHLSGEEPGGPGTLFVANHMSWLDIPVLATALDARFISKDEVAGWPLLGKLARRGGTLFVARDRRHEVAAQKDGIAARLCAGESLILFPEGTTSDGRGVLPFRSSLFAAAPFAARVQPLALRYRRRDGTPLEPLELGILGWVGAEPLLPNAARIARFGLSAEIRLLPPFIPAPEMTRKQLADQCREAVAAAYAA